MISQNVSQLEYIVIDGGSTDNTPSIIERYRSFIDVYITEKDYGIYDAMNKGISSATGDIIGILNSDDYYEKDTLKCIESLYRKNSIDIIYGNISLIKENNNSNIGNHLPFRFLSFRMSIPHPAVFVKRDIYRKYGLFDSNLLIAADYDFLYRVWNKKVSFGYIDKKLTYFRENGISQRLFMKCKLETDRVIDRHFDNVLFGNIVIESFLSGEKVYIWGTGFFGVKVYKVLEKTEVRILGFLDNDINKQNESLFNQVIFSIKALDSFDDVTIIIATIDYEEEIYNQIIETIGFKTKILKISSWLDEYSKKVEEKNGYCIPLFMNDI